MWLVAPCACVRGAQRKVSSRARKDDIFPCLGVGHYYARLASSGCFFVLLRYSRQHPTPKELIIHSPSFILPTHNPVLKRTPNWVLPVKSREILSTGRQPLQQSTAVTYLRFVMNLLKQVESIRPSPTRGPVSQGIAKSALRCAAEGLLCFSSTSAFAAMKKTLPPSRQKVKCIH